MRPPKATKRVSMILATAFAFLVGCSNALNDEVAKLTDEQNARVREILTTDQLKKLDDWISRNSSAGKGLPRGVTVDQALKDQDVWLAKKKIEEKEAGQLSKKMLADRAVKQEEFARMLSVSVMSKKNEVQIDDRKAVALDIAYANKSDKDIRGLRGVLKLRNIYGDSIIDINRYYDGEIPAKQTIVERSVVISIDKSVEPQENLWNTDFEKLKYTFEVHAIMFKDGTSVEVSY